jgi:hypothetical protein
MSRPLTHWVEHHTTIAIHRLLYIDSAQEVVSVSEVELQKPRNLSASESEERGRGEDASVTKLIFFSKTIPPRVASTEVCLSV